MPQTAADQQTDNTEEQSAQDQAGADESGVEEVDGKDDESGEEDGDEGTGEEIELLSKEQVEALKGDPAKLMKELNRAATKKFQETAAIRKNLESYAGFIEAVEKDPVAAVTAVAKRLGIKIADDAMSTETKAGKVVDALGDQITEAIRQSLGDDYGDLADRIGAGVHQALKLAVPELTKGTQAEIEAIKDTSAMRESQVVLEAFAKAHPDWKTYEESMTNLSKKFPPGEGVTEMEYLETLYKLASMDGKQGDGVKKVIKKMQSASKASSNDGTTVTSGNVTKTPTKPPTFAEAAAAARRGERFE